MFIHCGDSELPPQFLQGYVCVRGNNDFYYEYPEMKILELENHRMMIVHGHHHLYMGQLDMLVSKARRQGCDFVFYGHTHIFSSQQRDGVILVNPGALSPQPRRHAAVLRGDYNRRERRQYRTRQLDAAAGLKAYKCTGKKLKINNER